MSRRISLGMLICFLSLTILSAMPNGAHAQDAPPTPTVTPPIVTDADVSIQTTDDIPPGADLDQSSFNEHIFLPTIDGGNGPLTPFIRGEDGPPGAILTQPLDQLPPAQDLPIPEWTPSDAATSNTMRGVKYDPATGEETYFDIDSTEEANGASASEDSRQNQTSPIGQSPISPEVEIAKLNSFKPVAVSDLKDYPWRAIVNLSVRYNSSTFYVCNGVLVDARHVITSGYCVFAHDRGGWAKEIIVTPAQNAGSPYGSAKMLQPYSVTGWTQDENYYYNWGMIRLDRPIGALTSWIGWGHNSDDDYYSGRSFNNPSYLGSPRTLNNRSGTFDTINTTSFIHNGSWVSNINGSPAYIVNSGNYYVHGVASFSQNSSTKTGFARMVKSIFDIFVDIRDDNTPSSPDLIPLDVNAAVLESPIEAGEYLTAMDFLLHNDSSKTFNGTVNLRFYLSDNDDISTNDTLIGQTTVTPSGGLGAKNRTRVTVTSPPRIPLNTPTGNYWIGVYLDISDANTGNNFTKGWDAASISVKEARPLLVPSQTTVPFETAFGGAAPAAKTIKINNSGFGTFSWTAAADKPWIMLTPTSGNNGDNLEISIDMQKLPEDILIHDGTITINAPKTKTGSAKINVKLTLNPPELKATPATLPFTAELGTNPAPKSFTLDVDGLDNRDWTATSGNEWLTVSPTTGRGNQEITVNIDVSTLNELITYPGKVTIEIGSIAELVVEVPVTVVAGKPKFQFSPSQIEFSAIAGGPNPSAQAFAITNGNNFPFNWVATTNASWLPVKRGAGQTPNSFALSPEIAGLQPDTYNTEVVITSPDDPNARWTVPVKLTVRPAGSGTPIPQVGPSTLTFLGTVGGNNPLPQALSIQNAGEGTLNWAASADVSWLTLSPASGSNNGRVNVTANTNGMSAGVRRGVVTISSGTGNPSIQIGVVLILELPPTLAVDGTKIVFSGITGEGNPPPESFLVRNAGQGDLQWQAKNNAEWLTLGALSGSAPATVLVTPDIAGLKVGTHSGNIEISSANAAKSPQTVTSILQLRRGATLGTTPQSLYFDVIVGQALPAPEVLEIQNVARGNLNWEAKASDSWIVLEKSNGTVGAASRQPIKISVQPGDLEPRDEPYVGQITVNSSNGDGGPQTITVHMTVFSKARYCRIPQGGSDWILNTSHVKLKLENVERTGTPDGGCDLSARLRATLPQNANLSADVSGHVDSDNNFIPTSSSPLVLEIASFKLELTEDFSISDEYGIKAKGGTWVLPAIFGEESKKFDGEVHIGPRGLAIAGKGEFAFPDIDYGSLKMYDLKGTVRIATDGAYVVDLTGSLRVGVSKSPDAQAEGLKLTIDKRGLRSGKVGYFEIKNIGGVTIKVDEAVIESDKLRATTARIQVPKAWGGTEVDLYGLSIHKNGSVNITGGRFRLPEIDAGGDDFKLTSLEGEFKSIAGGGYQIRAAGLFGIKGLESVGSCSLLVDVTIETGGNGQSLLTVASVDRSYVVASDGTTNDTTQPVSVAGPPTIAAADTLRLRKLTIGLLDCQPGVAIGTTGFFITGVQGTIELARDGNLEKVTLKAWIESGYKLGTTPAVSAVPELTIRPKPFLVTYNGPTYFLRMKTADTFVEMSSRHFRTEVTYNYVVIHARMSVEAGLDNANRFYASGDGEASVSVQKGALGEVCDPTGLSGAFGGDPACFSIPDRDYPVANADAHIDLHGINGRIKVLGYGAKFSWSFDSGSVSFSLTRVVQTLSSAQVMQARAAWEAHQRGEVSTAALDARMEFANDGSIIIASPVTPTVPMVQAADAITTINNAMRQDVIFGIIQPANGTLSLVLLDPEGAEITPENLPAGIEYEETAYADAEKQISYSVAQAEPGSWRMKIVGDTANIPFFVTHAENVPPPVITDLAFDTDSYGGSSAYISVNLLTAEPGTLLNIYANSGTLTQTFTYTNAQGISVSEERYHYTGDLLHSEVISQAGSFEDTFHVTLDELPTATYHFWVEAIGPEGGTTRCYLTGSGTCEGPNAESNMMQMGIEHEFMSEWSPALNPLLDIKSGQLLLAWGDASHPDVGGYRVRLHSRNPITPTEELMRELEVNAAPNGDVKLLLDNLQPGEIYTVEVGVDNGVTGSTLWTEPQTIHTPQPGFIVAPQVDAATAAAGGWIVPAGGQAVLVPLGVDLSSNLPYAVEFFVNYDLLADGIYVEFTEDAIAASVTQGATGALVSAARTVPEGNYAIQVIARSGTLEYPFTINITVGPAQSVIFMPVIQVP